MADDTDRDIPTIHAKSERPAYALPETVCLVAIGCLDLMTTAYWIGSGYAYEGNPLMAGVFHTFGPKGLVAAKAALLALPLTVAELARRRNEPFVRSALRACIALYVTIYVLMFARYDSLRLLHTLRQ